MLPVLIKSARRTFANRRGSVALEFAIVAPLMFTMIMGIIEYGFVFYGYSSVQMAAAQTARDIAVNTSTIATAEADLNAKLPGWIGPSDVTVEKTSPGDLTKSEVVITAVTDAGNTTPIKIFTALIPMDMTTTIAVKSELPFDNDTGGGNQEQGGEEDEDEDEDEDDEEEDD